MLTRLDAFNQPRPRLGSLRCNPLKLERPAAQRGFSFALGGPVHKIQTGTAAIATGAFSSCLRVAPSGRRRSTFRSAGGGVGFQKGALRSGCRQVIVEAVQGRRSPHLTVSTIAVIMVDLDGLSYAQHSGQIVRWDVSLRCRDCASGSTGRLHSRPAKMRTLRVVAYMAL
jgi:hypothetical protein